MNIYIQYLDAEFAHLRTKFNQKESYATFEKWLMTTIRLHAVLGNKIYISDQQLFDSAVIWRLFSNKDFRDFAETTQFMRLVVDHSYNNEDISINGSRLLAKGLSRTFKPGWVSSVFESYSSEIVVLVKSLLDTYTKEQTMANDFENSRSSLRKLLDERKNAMPKLKGEYIDGFVHAIEYFSRQGNTVESQAAEKTNYYKVMNGRYSKADKDYREMFEKLEQSISEIEDDEDRAVSMERRGVLRKHVIRLPRYKGDTDILWANVVDAYNFANFTTVNADRMASASPGERVGCMTLGDEGSISEAIITPIDILRAKDKRPSANPLVLNLIDMPWALLSQLIQTIHWEQNKYQLALRNYQRSKSNIQDLLPSVLLLSEAIATQLERKEYRDYAIRLETARSKLCTELSIELLKEGAENIADKVMEEIIHNSGAGVIFAIGETVLSAPQVYRIGKMKPKIAMIINKNK